MSSEEDYELDEAELDDLELDEEDLAELEAFEQQLEDVDEEVLAGIDLEKGNVFIGAMRPRSSEEVLAELEKEMEREAEEAKKRSMLNTCRPGAVPKYLVNPFALENPMDYEEVFGDIDREEPQLRVWRIDHFAPVECTDDTWGKFCSADCYIVLFITDDDEQLVIHIHHWIGLKATPDKYGAAAFRAVELNTYLGGGCRIYREVEATESKMFVDYFGDRIEYLFGGTPCAFRHVDLDAPPNYPTRMYMLAKNPASKTLCMQLMDMSSKHLIQDRIIMVDCGQRIFLWNGRLSRVRDRHTALQYAVTIRSDERDDRARIVTVDDGNEDFDSRYDIQYFWDTLGGRIEPALPTVEQPTVTKIVKHFMYIGPADSMAVYGSWDNFAEPCYMTKVDDEEEEWDLEVALPPGEYLYMYKRTEGDLQETLCDMVRPTRCEGGKEFNIVKAVGEEDDGKYLLYTTCEREDGRLNLEGVEFDDLCSSLLNSSHAYILDCKSELFVWFGLKCNPLEKEVAIALANKFLEFERPEWATVILTQETAEPTSFRSKFSNWVRRQRPPKLCKTKSKGSLSVKFDLPAVVNVESQLRKAIVEPPYSIVANSAGTLDVYVTGDGASFENVPAHQRGIFYSGSSYVVVYKYSSPGARFLSYLVYFWSGIASNSNSEFSRFVLDFLSVLTKRVGSDRVTAVRVRQGKEPMDFMRLFGERMVVQNGSFARASRYNTPAARLFDVENRLVFDTLETRAVEVPPKCSSLSTERCFILVEKEQVRVWLGRNTNDTIRGRALDIAAHLRKSVKQHKLVVSYFEENASDVSKDAFLSFLSGSADDVQTELPPHVRAFCCSFSNGLLEVNELLDFCQYDLSLREQDTILVHTEKVLYLWIGPRSTPSVAQAARESCKLWLAYTAKNLTEQDFVIVHGGEEPAEFKALFHAWTTDVWCFKDQVGEQRSEELERVAMADALVKRNTLVYDRLKQRMELLERVAASTRYIEKEERLVFKAKHMVKVDWEQAWIREGRIPAKVQPEPSAMEKYKASLPEGETVFTWEEGEPLAVSVAGSWNDWQQQPLLKIGQEGFAISMELPVGRYYYHYCVATEDGVTNEVDGERVVVEVKARDGERNNVLRVYACVTAVQEEVEEEAEEEDLSKLSAAELIAREKEWRRQQREQREKRLQRQLDEQRALHATKAARTEKAPSPHSSPRSTRRSRMSAGGSSPSSSGAFMDSLLGALGTSPTHISSLRKSSTEGPRRKASSRSSLGSSPSARSSTASQPTSRRSLGSSPASTSLPSVSSTRPSKLSSKSAAINTSLEALAIVDAASATAKEKVSQGTHRRKPSSEAVAASTARLTSQLRGEVALSSKSIIRRRAAESVTPSREERKTSREPGTSNKRHEAASAFAVEGSSSGRTRREEKGEAASGPPKRERRVTPATTSSSGGSTAEERERRRAERRRQLGLE